MCKKKYHEEHCEIAVYIFQFKWKNKVRSFFFTVEVSRAIRGNIFLSIWSIFFPIRFSRIKIRNEIFEHSELEVILSIIVIESIKWKVSWFKGILRDDCAMRQIPKLLALDAFLSRVNQMPCVPLRPVVWAKLEGSVIFAFTTSTLRACAHVCTCIYYRYANNNARQ